MDPERFTGFRRVCICRVRLPRTPKSTFRTPGTILSVEIVRSSCLVVCLSHFSAAGLKSCRGIPGDGVACPGLGAAEGPREQPEPRGTPRQLAGVRASSSQRGSRGFPPQQRVFSRRLSILIYVHTLGVPRPTRWTLAPVPKRHEQFVRYNAPSEHRPAEGNRRQTRSAEHGTHFFGSVVICVGAFCLPP